MKQQSKKFLIVVLILALLGGLVYCFYAQNSDTEEDSNELVVFNYGDYIAPDVIEAFEEETGIEVKYEEYVTQEDMYTKFESGGINYDVICTSEYMITKMIQNDLLESIDTDAMENFRYLDDTSMNFCKTFDPQNQYAIPHFLGTLGILYNTTMVEDVPDSWSVFYDEQYKNSMIVNNSMTDAIVMPLKLMGESINTHDKVLLEKVKDSLCEQKSLTMAYLVDEIRDVMILGDAAIAETFSGDATEAIEANEDLDYVIPKEGSNVWIDAWVIPKTVTHKAEALKFLDFLCRPEIALENFEYIYYTTPNKGAKALLDEETLADQTIFPSEETLANCEVRVYAGEEMEAYYNQLWKEIKSY